MLSVFRDERMSVIEPIRVAHVMGKMVGGGVESVVMNYYRHVNRAAVQFDFLIDADSVVVPTNEIESLGGRIIEVPPYQDVHRYLDSIEVLCRSEQWKIVHSHINTLSVFPLYAAKIAGVPVRIAHSHSTAGRGEFKRNVLKSTLRPFSTLYPTHRLACSKHAGEWLFGKKASFQVLSNAIELERYSYNERERDSMRDCWGVSDDTFVVGHVGRFMHQKNHTFLIDIFAEVVAKRPASVLVLVGGGSLRAAIEQKVLDMGLRDKVIFEGQRDDVWRLYSAFDVFLLPSYYEGLGMVGVEAQRSGVPCFFSDKVPREIELTNLCEFISLNQTAKAWGSAILKSADRARTPLSSSDAQAFDSYDIRDAAVWLEKYYLKAFETCIKGS